MANDYMDSWELNGDIVLLQDFGKGENGGVGVLDENGKIPLANVPAIYTSNLITSKKDSRKMTLEEWTNRAVPFLNNYGTIWNDDTSEYIVNEYYADLDIKFAFNSNNQRVISVKGSPYQPVSFREISYCVGNVLGIFAYGSTVDFTNYYVYIDDLTTVHQHNYTYITSAFSIQPRGFFVLNNTLFLLGYKNMGNNVYYVSLMTSEDGINFVEQYEHEYTYSGGSAYYHEAYTAAYNNGIYVFRSSYFTITLKDNTFYYNEETEPNVYSRVYFFKGVFTDLHQWSTDGITWTAVSYPDGEPSFSAESLGVLFNRIVFDDNSNDAKFWYTEDGKVIHSYAFELYIGTHISTNALRRMNFMSTYSAERLYTTTGYNDNGVLFCYGSTGSGGDNRHIIYATKDAEHFTELFVISEDYGDYTVSLIYDKGKAYISDVSTNGIILHKQSPDPDLWLPYSTHKDYIKGGN